MNIRNIDLNLLPIFNALISHKSITRAAARLGMSQPAVSHALGRLRDSLGDPLFVRSGSGMVPTARAAELAEPVRQVLGVVEREILRAPDFDPAVAQRDFTLALGDTAIPIAAQRLVEWCRARAPGIGFRFDPRPGEELVGEIRDGSVDLAMSWSRVTHASLACEVVGRERSVCIARRGQAIGGETRVAGGSRRSRLTERKFLAASHAISPDFERVVPATIRNQLERARRIAVRVPSPFLLPAIVARSDLLAVVPEQLALEFEQSLALRIFPNPVAKEKKPFYAIWNRDHEADAAHVWLRGLLLQVARASNATLVESSYR